MMLDDLLASYEAAARDACTGLADRITSRAIGMHAPAEGITWLDIAIVEAETRGDPRQRAEVVVTTTIGVAVRDSNTGRGARLERWIDGNAYERILHAAPLADLYAKIDPGQVSQVASDISGTMVVYLQRTIRSVLGNFKMQRRAVLGLTARTDSGISTTEGAEAGRALDTQPGRAISWLSPGLVLGPIAGEVIYAGAQGNDVIEVLDAADQIIDTVPVGTLPTGTLFTSVDLGAGDYRARLGDAITERPLEVTVRPG